MNIHPGPAAVLPTVNPMCSSPHHSYTSPPHTPNMMQPLPYIYPPYSQPQSVPSSTYPVTGGAFHANHLHDSSWGHWSEKEGSRAFRILLQKSTSNRHHDDDNINVNHDGISSLTDKRLERILSFVKNARMRSLLLLPSSQSYHSLACRFARLHMQTMEAHTCMHARVTCK